MESNIDAGPKLDSWRLKMTVCPLLPHVWSRMQHGFVTVPSNTSPLWPQLSVSLTFDQQYQLYPKHSQTQSMCPSIWIQSMGLHLVIHVIFGVSIINHPAIGVPPWLCKHHGTGACVSLHLNLLAVCWALERFMEPAMAGKTHYKWRFSWGKSSTKMFFSLMGGEWSELFIKFQEPHPAEVDCRPWKVGLKWIGWVHIFMVHTFLSHLPKSLYPNWIEVR